MMRVYRTSSGNYGDFSDDFARKLLAEPGGEWMDRPPTEHEMGAAEAQSRGMTLDELNSERALSAWMTRKAEEPITFDPKPKGLNPHPGSDWADLRG